VFLGGSLIVPVRVYFSIGSVDRLAAVSSASIHPQMPCVGVGVGVAAAAAATAVASNSQINARIDRHIVYIHTCTPTRKPVSDHEEMRQLRNLFVLSSAVLGNYRFRFFADSDLIVYKLLDNSIGVFLTKLAGYTENIVSIVSISSRQIHARFTNSEPSMYCIFTVGHWHAGYEKGA